MFWLWVSITFAVLNWVAVWRSSARGVYVGKPLMMVALIVYFYTHVLEMGLPDQSFAMAIGISLVLYLAGDIFLMLPGNWFHAGLVAFMLGHFAYLFGFLFQPLTLSSVVPLILITLIVAGVNIYFVRRVYFELRSKMRRRARIPVLVYALVLSMMLITSLARLLAIEWDLLAAGLVSIGAILFVGSDMTNAWLRFVSPVRQGKLKVMLMYHLGQIAIVSGVLLYLDAR